MIKHFANQRGDTLIEVTLALAILSLVLVGAFVTANKAFLLGQEAKYRSQLVNDAQQQAEALVSFRNSYNWTTFKDGDLPNFLGVLNAAAGGTCQCFHMAQRGSDGWVPVSGQDSFAASPAHPAGETLQITNSSTVSSLPMYDFTITYSAPMPGSSSLNMSQSIYLNLGDLDRLRQ